MWNKGNFYFIAKMQFFDCSRIGNMSLNFNKGLNLIYGDNGSGKSTLAKAILTREWLFGGKISFQDEGDSDYLKRWSSLSFFDAEFFLKGEPQNWVLLAWGSSEIKKIANDIFQNILSKKIHSKNFSKFSGFEDLKFLIEIDNLLRVFVLEKKNNFQQTSIGLFDAYDERIIIHFSLVCAVRKYLEIRTPLIFDNIFGFLDEDLRFGVFEHISKMDSQIICFLNSRDRNWVDSNFSFSYIADLSI